MLVVGVLLWRAGFIQVTHATGWPALLDVAVLVLSLDLLMYVFHRVAHHLLLYRWVHATHHIYDKPRLLTLFALNPIEALGFGCMLILVCLVYPVSALGLSIYLLLNVLFGLVGHIGVEPLRQQWLRLPVLRFISTSTFHAEHHHDGRHNFGFYTLLWDKVFGTAAPEYSTDFGEAGQRTIQGHSPR